MKNCIFENQISLFDELAANRKESSKRGNCFRCVYFESHRCRNRWVNNKPCPDGMHYDEYIGSTVRQCLCATVEVFQDEYVYCPILDSVGCEKCVKDFGDGSGFERDESQNYERIPDGKYMHNDR